jgi:hypothetical protein
MFTLWFNTDFKVLLKFIKNVKILCKKREFNTFLLNGPYGTFWYQPSRIKTYMVRLNNRRKRVLYHIPQIDYKKISSAYVANLFQFFDSILLMFFLKHLVTFCVKHNIKNIPIFTNHDRFFIHPKFALYLRGLLKEAYISFYEYHIIFKLFNETNLQDAFSFYGEILQKNDINHPLFVKF